MPSKKFSMALKSYFEAQKTLAEKTWYRPIVNLGMELSERVGPPHIVISLADTRTGLMVFRYLKQDGLDVWIENDGLRVLERIESSSLPYSSHSLPDLLIIEDELPSRGGLEVLSDLRAAGIHIPAILLSEQVNRKLYASARKLDAMVMGIPLDFDALSSAANLALGAELFGLPINGRMTSQLHFMEEHDEVNALLPSKSSTKGARKQRHAEMLSLIETSALLPDWHKYLSTTVHERLFPVSSADERTSEDRRSAPRAQAQMTMLSVDDVGLRAFSVENVSAGGALVQSPHYLPTGWRARQEFTLPDKSATLRVRSEVVHRREHPELFEVGFRFIDMTSSDQACLWRYVQRAA